jgi:predicted phage gp36 major capsid-like protein
MKRMLFCSVAASAVFAMAVSNADAAARKHHPKGHSYAKTWTTKPHHQQYVRVAVDGVAIDRDGWRYWKSWDNTCFRTLDHLSSHSACTGGGP